MLLTQKAFSIDLVDLLGAGRPRRDDAVLVGGPDRAVAPQKRGPRALLSTETQRSREQAVDEPLESHRDLVQLPAPALRHPVDHTAAHQRLSDRRIGAPPGTV